MVEMGTEGEQEGRRRRRGALVAFGVVVMGAEAEQEERRGVLVALVVVMDVEGDQEWRRGVPVGLEVPVCCEEVVVASVVFVLAVVLSLP